MRRFLQAPRAIFCFILQRQLAFFLFFCSLLAACSLPPKPRFTSRQITPLQTQKTKTIVPRETRMEKQKKTVLSHHSIPRNNKKTDPRRIANVKIIFGQVQERNTDERLLSALGVFLNAPYALGGVTPEGVDCSGLIKTVFAEVYGFNLPHNAASQFHLGAGLFENDLRLGDLVFFATSSRRGQYINHVGIYLTNRRFIHASTKAGVIVSGLDEAYWRRRYAGARRLIAQP